MIAHAPPDWFIWLRGFIGGIAVGVVLMAIYMAWRYEE